MISDMEAVLDPSQFGNRKGRSINHYLIKMINRILTVLDNNLKKELFAVVANLIDWSKAFPIQCPRLGVNSFIRNGVRPSLIPLLVSYFQDCKITVKWHGCQSTQRNMPGGGPAGATIGLLEYLSQSNNNANCVNEEDRFKFVDDLNVLEIVNLLTVGISSFNVKNNVPKVIPDHNQYISSNNLQSQQFLDEINQSTMQHKMKMNQKKTETMLLNFTNKFQFMKRLSLNGENVEVVSESKLLGKIISNDLKWTSNTTNIVSKFLNGPIRKACRIWCPCCIPQDHIYIIHKECFRTECSGLALQFNTRKQGRPFQGPKNCLQNYVKRKI